MFSMINILTLKEIDWQPLKSIVSTTKAKVFLFCRLVKSVRPLSSKFFYFYLINIKIVVILVILCYFVYQNKSNYILFLIVFYLYSIREKIDAIIFLNYFSLSVSYIIL